MHVGFSRAGERLECCDCLTLVCCDLKDADD